MPNCFEIFCGLGGLSQGFCQAGYDLKLGLEIEEAQLEIFKVNHPETPTICKDIRLVSPEEMSEVSKVKKGDLDVLLGGPPCQGFSTYGKRDNLDPRNSLYEEYAKIIDFFNPKVILLENVTGILSMDDGNVVKNILKLFKEQFGYTTTVMVLDAVNFGVPQFRKRVFFVGYKGSKQPIFPRPTHRNPKFYSVPSKNDEFDFTGKIEGECFEQKSYDRWLTNLSASLPKAVTVSEAISDLPLEAFKPKETNTTFTEYSMPAASAYQKEMRKTSRGVFNHSAKQHLLIRQARTLLMEPGEYGDKLHERVDAFQKVAEAVEEMSASIELRTVLKRARTVDVQAEEAFLKQMKNGAHVTSAVASHIESGGFRNKYRRLQGEKPSHTLVAHMARDCSDFIHPKINRPISVREAARLQSFPDTFIFRSSQFRQLRGIGNSVPPKLAFALAKQIAKDLNLSMV